MVFIDTFGFQRTQAVYQLTQRRYVSKYIVDSLPYEPPLTVDNVFFALGMRFLVEPLGLGYPCRVDKGWFPSYQRVITADMKY